MSKLSSFFNIRFIILAAVIILGSFLRVYNLSNVPPSASMDEASIGYNAYSILLTGKDEYLTKFPLLLRAFDDWRPSLYVYLVIPFVKIFGLSVLSVRLPSVILSILTITVTYLLVKTLFKRFDIAIFASLLLAISPWHIYISRLGHEANAGLTFFVLGLYLFFRKNPYISLVFFALSFISYQSEKIIIPLIVAFLFYSFRKQLVFVRRNVVFALLVSAIITFPFLKASLSTEALIRFKGTSILNPGVTWEQSQQREKNLAAAVKKNDFFGKIVYSQKTYNLQLLGRGYFSHFNFDWLFLGNSNESHKIPGLGLLYLWEAPFILIGIFYLFKKIDFKTKSFIFFWFLIVPIPAAITTDSPHAMRSYLFLPAWQIFSSLGIVYSIDFLRLEKIKRIAYSLVVIFIALSSVYLFRQYFYVFPKNDSGSFQYALSKTIPYVKGIEKSYNKIVFSNQGNFYQSYMFYLFYNKYDPKIYQKNGGTKSGGFSEEHFIGKYEFRPISYNKEEKGSLLVGNTEDLIDRGQITTLKDLDGTDAIIIVQKDE